MLERSSKSQIKRKRQKFDAQTTQAGEKCVQASQKREKMLLERNSESQVNIKQQKIDAQTTQAGEKCVQASQKVRKNVTRKKLRVPS